MTGKPRSWTCNITDPAQVQNYREFFRKSDKSVDFKAFERVLIQTERDAVDVILRIFEIST